MKRRPEAYNIDFQFSNLLFFQPNDANYMFYQLYTFY